MARLTWIGIAGDWTGWNSAKTTPRYFNSSENLVSWIFSSSRNTTKNDLTKKLTFFIRLETLRVFMRVCATFACRIKCFVADNILHSLFDNFSRAEMSYFPVKHGKIFYHLWSGTIEKLNWSSSNEWRNARIFGLRKRDKKSREASLHFLKFERDVGILQDVGDWWICETSNNLNI